MAQMSVTLNEHLLTELSRLVPAPLQSKFVGEALREKLDRLRRDQVKPAAKPLLNLHNIMDRLRSSADELKASYADPVHREIAWQNLRMLTSGPLWETVEPLTSQPFRRQLADVLDAAVTKLGAFQLEKKHLLVIDSTLKRLAAATVTEDDVDACETEWRHVEVDTLPSLGDAFEKWLESSSPSLANAE